MKLLKFKLPLAVILIIFGVATPSIGVEKEGIVSSYIYCSEDVTKRISSCPNPEKNFKGFWKNLKSKEYTTKEVQKNIQQFIPPCGLYKKGIPEPFRLPLSQREDKIIEDLLKELSQSNGRSLEKIFGSKIIVKSGGIWLTDEGFLATKEWGIYKLFDELIKAEGNIPYGFYVEPKDFPKEIYKVRGSSFVADRGIKVPDGWLLGNNHGEFGGDLIFANENKETYVVINDNVIGIYNSPIGIVVVTGLGHGNSSYGYLYTVAKVSGKWVAKEFASIYESPYLVEPTPDGKIIIANDFGSFLLDKDGLCRSNAIGDK